MRLASVTFDTLTRKPDTHDLGTQTSQSKHFTAPAWDIEWKDGRITISHPSGEFPANILPQERVTASSELKEAPAKKPTVAKATADKATA